MENKNKGISGGVIFIGCMFLGAGIGMAYGKIAVGGAIGMGIGFIAMGLIGKNPEK